MGRPPFIFDMVFDLLVSAIVEAIMAGKAPRTLTLAKLGTNLPFSSVRSS